MVPEPGTIAGGNTNKGKVESSHAELNTSHSENVVVLQQQQEVIIILVEYYSMTDTDEQTHPVCMLPYGIDHILIHREFRILLTRSVPLSQNTH